MNQQIKEPSGEEVAHLFPPSHKWTVSKLKKGFNSRDLCDRGTQRADTGLRLNDGPAVL